MKPHKNLLESLLSLSALQASNHILYLMIVPCLVRALGAEHFGALAFSQSFAQYFMILTDYGFNLSATRNAATIRGDQKELSLLLSTVMTIKIVLFCISAALFFLLVLCIPFFRVDYALHSVVFLSVLGNALFPTWIYQGMEKMRYLAVIGVTARGLMLAATLVLIHDPADYLTAAWIQSVSLVGSGFLALLIVPAALKLKIVKPSYSLSGRLLREGWNVFLSSVAVSLYTNSNVFVVGLLAGPAEVGFFSASEKARSSSAEPYVAFDPSRLSARKFSCTILSHESGLIPIRRIENLRQYLIGGIRNAFPRFGLDRLRGVWARI